MPIIGSLIRKGLKLGGRLEQQSLTPYQLQTTQLQELLQTALETKFGKHYQFNALVKESDPVVRYTAFKKLVPIHTYNKMFSEWWHLSKDGEKDVCWPGSVKYFALSSGTSESSSKYIPLTKDMKKANQKASLRQLISLSMFDLPEKFFQSSMLWVGGSTNLNKRDKYYEGDLSGIQAAQLPFWIKFFYKPGKKIAKTLDWEAKLEAIVENAKNWDIGVVAGVPAWVQLLFERIIEHYKLKHMHELWPNLDVYCHGGVSFDPYRKGFQKLLGKPIHFVEIYPASEGFIAYQAHPGKKSMKMILNNGLFFEFIPFNEQNFDENGEVREQAEACMINAVEEGKDYALILSSCAGAWRYLIGDVIRFTSVEEAELVVTGRTKHYLSLCGEHLSVDNMNKAIELVSDELGVTINEYTVAGIPFDGLFAHHWYIGCDQLVDAAVVREKIDKHLCALNDDYAVERIAALKDVLVEILPLHTFYDWMEHTGKKGGQHKFPRVLKGDTLENWKSFLENRK